MEETRQAEARGRQAVGRWVLVAVFLTGMLVLPFVMFGGTIERWVMQWLSQRHATVASVLVLGGILVSDVLLPVPSSVVAVAAGMRLGFWGGVATIAVGSTLGCWLGWAIGRGFGRPGLRRLVGGPALARFDALVRRYGAAALLVARPVPVLAEASVIAAGAGRFGMLATLGWTTGANLLVAIAYAGAGDLAATTDRHGLALVAALGLPGLAIAMVRWVTRRGAIEPDGSAQRSPGATRSPADQNRSG